MIKPKNINSLGNENWMPINGYENRYLISDHGRIYSIERKDRLNRTWGGHLLNPDIGRYKSIRLNKKGGVKKLLIHRLVALHFLPKPDKSSIEINHKDSDPFNNHVNNLEWCTRKQNMKHAYANGGVGPIGEINGNAKLTEQQVLKIRSAYKKGDILQADLADEFGVSKSHISEIINYNKWGWLQ